MSTFEDILDAARALTATDRLRLVDALWEDASPSEWPAPSKEWIAEAQRRSAEYDEGRMPAAPWPEVRAKARRKARLDD
jgi:putative addiction module component (TIGR02574 family)